MSREASTEPTPSSADAPSSAPSETPEQAPVEQAPVEPGRGPKRARFLETLPDDAALRELADAFEAGNYARVRSEAPRLAQSSESEEVRAAALDLARRIEPDPLVKYLFLLAVLLLLAVTAFAYGGHVHG